MGKLGRSAVALLATTVVVCGVSACGGGGGGGGKQGGSIKVGGVGPDKYDPVLFQTVQGTSVLQLVYTPLLTYKDAEGAEGAKLIPGVAESLPKISNGGKTLKLRVRKGLTYSDGTRVKASDFEHSLKRMLKLNGPFASFYTGIVGAAAFQKKGDETADIPGIVTNDKTGDITINMTAGDTKFPYALTEPGSAPTPAAKSPFKALNKNPPPGVSRYTLKVVDPTRQYVLTKNPKFDIPGMAKGKVAKITGVVSNSVPKMTQDVIKGNLDYITEDPTGDLLPLVERKYKDRFRLDTSPPNTYYFFMNVKEKPFDKLEARQAVNYAIDSRALVRVFGGRLDPDCTFLPPEVTGYKKNASCPYGDPNGPGNVAKAKQLVQKSGTKGQKVTVWTNTKDPRPAIGDYLRDTLNSIGWKASVKTLNQDVYFEAVGTPSNHAQIGFTDWFQDFPNPADFFEPLLTGKSLKSTPTFNEGQVNDPAINAKVDKLSKVVDATKVADQWADLDKEVVGPSKAFVAPYGHEKASTFMSERMNFKDCAGVHPVWRNDWALFCLK
jgi:peptide/nickel transport system substrate-binding protein